MAERSPGSRRAIGVHEGPLIQCPKCLQRLDAEGANYCPSCGEDLRGMTPTSDTLSGPWTGKIIEDRYKLIEKLGEGGMGTVYKVEHVRMGKVLALKLLRPDLAIDKKLKQRFVQEARVVSRLSHPNTIQVFDFGELDDGSLYIAMEFLPGRDLMWTLRTHGPFSEERAIHIGIQVLASLSEAHELGIIHRDIKPANVMLLRRKDGGDTVKVLDFGIAKLNEGEGRKHITGIADFVGTPAYMSPEQARGEELDARSDLYSVAAMLFELVTGSIVFDGPTPMSIVTKHMTEPPPRFAAVAPEKVISPAFEAVVRKALSKDRADRYPSADAMREALEKVRRDIASTHSDYTPSHEYNTALVASREDFDRFERSLRRNRVLLPIAAVTLLAAAGVGGWQLLARSQADRVRTAELEPNDDPGRATKIPFGAEVTGTIGVATSADRSDVDVYEVTLPTAQAVTIELSGVPDLNLVLTAHEMADATGTGAGGKPATLPTLVTLDDGRVGAGERVDGLKVKAGALFLRIQERPHASEPPGRPPRSNPNLPYTLVVRPTGKTDRLEDEPRNDTVDTVAAQPMDRAIRAFTGTAILADEAAFERGASAVDLFKVQPAANPQARVFAAVVPPAQGRLLVLDEAAVTAWRAAATARPRGAARPEGEVTRDGPLVLPVQEGRAGYIIRVQPYFPGAKDVDPAELLREVTPPGSEYYVAFFTDQAGGVEGLVDLLSVLEADQHPDVARKLVDAARKTLKGTPALTELNGKLGTTLAADAVR
ncbi:MAG: serine/threonine protein kinase [Myxococcaceae bacterium]|nr:serine/threonine protein kinase [Myxococcaceae bacterium]